MWLGHLIAPYSLQHFTTVCYNGTLMTSFHILFFSSIILSISLFPDSMVPRQKGYF